jgi:hypothetical protein
MNGPTARHAVCEIGEIKDTCAACGLEACDVFDRGALLSCGLHHRVVGHRWEHNFFWRSGESQLQCAANAAQLILF